MNVRRGFFRTWVVFSLVWIVSCFLILDFSCLFEPDPWCDSWGAAQPLTSVYAQNLAITFGVPIAALATIAALKWITGGVRM